MSDKTVNNVLNLDEVLGEQSLIVRIGEEKYRVRTIKSLSPKDFAKVIRIGNVLTNLSDEQMSRSNGMYVQKFVDDLIETLVPDMPRHILTWRERLTLGYKRRFDITLVQMIAIMEFWSQHSSPQKKKTVTAAKKKKSAATH